MQKDIITKKSVKILLKGLSELLFGFEVRDINFIDKELQRIEKREADIVAKCKIDDKEEILHIEIQNDYDKNMPNRMARYYLDIDLIYPDIPIRQYLIYIGKKRCYIKDRLEKRGISYHYTIIDMHTIDCKELLELDTPESLVLAILCDFKGRDELDIITYILKRLYTLVKDSKRVREYIEILEILSTNRELKDKIKEAEKMIRTTRYEELPSYEIGLEKGIEKGIEKGMEKGIEKGIILGKLEMAKMMMKEFNLSVKEVADRFKLPIDELNRYLKD